MNAVRRLLYIAYLAAFFVAVLFVLWLRYVSSVEVPVQQRGPLDLERPPRHVTREMMRHLGSIQVARKSSFTKFELEKPPNTARVCALGDSFTYGDEVGPASDFPTQLQAVFQEHGQQVQVLNFGNSWWGFHQTVLMWRLVASRFECDAVVLGPMSFFPLRDTRFNHTWSISPNYFHARFVLEGDATRLLSPLGETSTERFAAYFSFIPRWQYLRYDRGLPAALEAVVGADSTLENPLYYSARSLDDEAYATYRILLRELADSANRVLLINVKQDVLQMAAELAHPNLAVAESFPFEWAGQRQPVLFPHTAPKGHYSVSGNRVLAEQIYGYLNGVASPEVELVRFDDVSTRHAGASPETNAPMALADVDRFEVALEDRFHGELRTAHRRYRYRGKRIDPERVGASGLLAIQGPGEDLVNAAYVLVPVPLVDGMPLVLTAGEGELDRELGVVRVPDSSLPFGVVRTETTEFVLREALVAAKAHEGEAVLLAETPILGVLEDGELEPRIGRLLHAVAHRPDDVPRDLPATGVVDLRFVTRDGGVRALPIARWRMSAEHAPEWETPVGSPLVAPSAVEIR